MFQPYEEEIPAIFATTAHHVNSYASNVLNSVTGMVSVTCEDDRVVKGSCFFYSSSFFVITCAHILRDYKFVKVRFPQHQSQNFDVSVVDINFSFDLAVLCIDSLAGRTHQLRDLKIAPNANQGITTFCGGYFNDEFHFTRGLMETSSNSL